MSAPQTATTCEINFTIATFKIMTLAQTTQTLMMLMPEAAISIIIIVATRKAAIITEATATITSAPKVVPVSTDFAPLYKDDPFTL